MQHNMYNANSPPPHVAVDDAPAIHVTNVEIYIYMNEVAAEITYTSIRADVIITTSLCIGRLEDLKIRSAIFKYDALCKLKLITLYHQPQLLI